jgi:hypothetical protein
MYLLDPLADDLDKLGQRLAGTLPHVKDIMSTLAMGQDGVALSAGEAKAAEKELEDEHKVLAEAQKKAAVEAQKWSDLLHEIGTVGQTTQITIDALSGSVVEGTEFYLEHGVAIDKIAKLYGITKEQVDAVKQSIKDESDTLKVWGSIHEQTYKLAQEHEKAWRDEALKGAAEVNKSIIEGLTETTAARLKLEDFTAQQTQLSTDYQVTKIWEVANQQIAAFKGTEQQRAAFNANVLALADAQTDALYLDTKALHDNSIDSLQDTADKAAATYLAMVDAPDQYSTATIERFHKIADAAQEAADGTEQSWTDAFAALKGIGNSTVSSVIDQFVRLRSAAKSVQSGMASDTSEGAVQAGAGLVKLGASAVSAYQQIQEGGAKATASGILSMTETGAAIGSIIPGIGTAVGAGIGAIVGVFAKLTAGASAAEKEGRQVEATFEQSFGGFSGMMDTVGKAYTTAGLGAQQAQADVAALMDAEKNGSAATKAAIDRINGVIAASTAVVASAVGGILDSAKTVGTNFPDAMQPMIANLLSLPGITDAEKNSLLGLLHAGEPSFENLSSAAGRYGLSLDALGGKAAQLSISHEADQIESDYDTLVTKSGADSDTVLAGMKTSLTKLVDHALDAGAVLPTALQPLVKQLIDTGQLTDTAGNKITDLGKLKFDDTGDPLASGMKSLTDAITNLGNILQGLPKTAQDAASGMGAALATVKVPTIHVPVQFDHSGDDPTAHAAEGGFVTAHGVSYYDMGGFVPRGTDTVPAMLTPGEAILNRGAVASIGRDQISAWNRGGPSGADSHPGTESRLDAIATLLQTQGKQIAQLMGVQAFASRDALLARGTR